jgi:hypothetical protein
LGFVEAARRTDYVNGTEETERAVCFNMALGE